MSAHKVRVVVQAARQRIEDALAIDSEGLLIIYGAAHAYEQLGERDKALHWTEIALDRGYPTGEIERDPFMQALKKDEKFQALLANRGE